MRDNLLETMLVLGLYSDPDGELEARGAGGKGRGKGGKGGKGGAKGKKGVKGGKKGAKRQNQKNRVNRPNAKKAAAKTKKKAKPKKKKRDPTKRRGSTVSQSSLKNSIKEIGNGLDQIVEDVVSDEEEDATDLLLPENKTQVEIFIEPTPKLYEGPIAFKKRLFGKPNAKRSVVPKIGKGEPILIAYKILYG